MKTPAKDIITESILPQLIMLYAGLLTFSTLVTILLTAALAYTLNIYLVALLFVLYPLQYSIIHALFLFSATYTVSLIFEDETPQLKDSILYSIGSLPLAVYTPFFTLQKRDTTRRYMAYVETIFTGASLNEAYSSLENAPDAIGGAYKRHNVVEGAGIIVAFFIFLGLSLLTPSLAPLILFYFFLWLLISFSLWLYGKAKKHVDRSALYVYLKTGRILSPYTYEDLQKRIQ